VDLEGVGVEFYRLRFGDTGLCVAEKFGLSAVSKRGVRDLHDEGYFARSGQAAYGRVFEKDEVGLRLAVLVEKDRVLHVRFVLIAARGTLVRENSTSIRLS
jgi:hypothetical protein